ncbi:hypothetical protein BDR22DRAFT_839541 [Usnea florida]
MFKKHALLGRNNGKGYASAEHPTKSNGQGNGKGKLGRLHSVSAMVRSTIPTNREAVRSPEIVPVSLKSICLCLRLVSGQPLHGNSQRVVLCLMALSLNKFLSSHSSCSTISSDLSMDAENLRPSFFQRLMRSISCLRRRSLVSSLSQILHFCWSCEVVMTSLEPHVSPVRYSRLQCCLKWPHL